MRRRKSLTWRSGGPLALAVVAALVFLVTGGWGAAQGQESPLATPVPAEAAPPPAFVPVTLPSISGTLHNSAGEPLAGLIVVAYRRQQANWATARQTTTDAAGAYTFPWMPAGTYRLYIHDPQDVYAATYYPDAADIEAAADLIVVGSPVAAVDAQIAPGGQITGTLSWPDGPAPINSNIELYYVTAAPITTRLSLNDDLSLAPELRQYRLVASKSLTDTVAHYAFGGLAAGSYRVCAEAVALTSNAFECFDDVALGVDGTDVVVAVGATVANVNLALGDKADFGSLTGQVVALGDQTPAAGVNVEIAPAPGIDFFAAPQPQQATTNDDGRFHFDVPAGHYTVRFSAADGLYLPSEYRALTETVATVLTVEPTTEITLSAAITRAGLITGNVTIAGVNAGMGGQVTAFHLGEQGWTPGGTGNIVAATGAYTVTGLRGGSYRLQYGVDIPTSIYYGPPGATLETATDVAVVTGTTVGGINMDLTPYIAGVAYGSITGTVTVESVAQPNLVVSLFDAAFDCCITPPPLVTTVTDEQGHYRLAGLPPGRYKIGVSPAGQPAPALYAPDQRIFETAAIYAVGNPADGASRQVIADVNINLGPTGSVARTVHRPDDTPVVGATVNLFQKLGDAGNWPLVASTVTDAEGKYAFAGLAPDIYQVCLVAAGIPTPSCGGRGGQGTGLDVVVTAGQEATGIDILDVP